MYLKWKDYSGASHVIEGVESVSGYPRALHEAEARAIAESYDGDEVVLYRMAYPDIWYSPVEDAERAGFSFDREPVDHGDHTTPVDVAVSVIAHDDVKSNSPDAAPGGSRAVWVRESIRSGEVLRVQPGERSYGVYVAYCTSGGDRRHLFIDTAGPVYLMSNTGQTIDRFAID